jgi:hypothetical protein
VKIRYKLLQSHPTTWDTPKELRSAFEVQSYFGGIIVEFLGVSQNPSKDRTWWQANGAPLHHRPYRPYERLGASVETGKNQVAREIAVQVPGGASVRWQFDPPMDFSASDRPTGIGKDAGYVRAVAVRMLANQQTANVRVGVASVRWETAGESTGNGGDVGGGKQSVVFSPAQEKNGGVSVTVTYDRTDWDVCLVATVTDGRGYAASETQWGNTGKRAQLTATFAKLSLKDIKGFRLLKRPYQWIEFRNVSLQPGKKTDVQVSLPASSAAGPFRF